MAEPAVFLKALTPEAKASLGAVYHQITRFPFRVGRECRNFERPINFPNTRRRPDSVPNNDVYLVELGTVLSVSREHFQIDRQPDGGYQIVDRGSSCGTLVEGEFVGEKKKGGAKPLHNNDVIIVGSSESKFIFKFLIAPD